MQKSGSMPQPRHKPEETYKPDDDDDDDDDDEEEEEDDDDDDNSSCEYMHTCTFFCRAMGAQSISSKCPVRRIFSDRPM